MNSSRIALFGLLFVVSLTLVACESGAESADAGWEADPTAPRAFVSTLGVDTVTVELYTRTAESIDGVLVERTPVTQITRYSGVVDEGGSIIRFQGERSTPGANPDGPGAFAWNVIVSADSAVVERSGGDNPGSSGMAVSGEVIPTLGRPSAAMYVFEQVALQLAEDSSVAIHLVGPTNTRPSPNASRIVGADTIAMDFFGASRYAWLGESDQILGASGAETTLKVETRRVPSVDPDALAARWAAMDARGEGIGPASIPGNVSASVDGADIEIVYTRPAMRGREIWGGLVPYGEVWRTGANAATHFTTSADLSFGDFELPAGTYTLWSRFSPDDQSLIINSQTQQWGTQHDAETDLVALPLMHSSLDEPVERFTIFVEEADEGGRLGMEWDRSRFWVDFSVQ